MPFNKFQPDTLIVINGAKYRPIGYANGRHQWMHLQTGEMFRCSDRDGTIAFRRTKITGPCWKEATFSSSPQRP